MPDTMETRLRRSQMDTQHFARRAARFAAQVDQLTQQLTALQNRRVHSTFAQVPISGAIVLNATLDLPVQWPAPLPCLDYQVQLVSTPDMLIGKLRIDAVSARTATGCTVRLRATSAVGLSGSLVLNATCIA